MLYERIAGEDDSFLFYDDGLSLLSDLNFGRASAGLILLDYKRYKSFSDFIFDFLRAKNLKIPVVLLGNPHSTAQTRPGRWISENELQYDIQTLHTMRDLLEKISAAVDCDEIQSGFAERPFDRKASPSLSGAESLRLESAKVNPVETLRRNSEFPPEVLRMFSYLYKNRRREVALEEIASVLNIAAESEKMRKNTAYAYISRLRKYVEKTSLCTMKLVRTRKGFYQLIPK